MNHRDEQQAGAYQGDGKASTPIFAQGACVEARVFAHPPKADFVDRLQTISSSFASKLSHGRHFVMVALSSTG